jgi:RimJ/RimL family protein N-acetyltransferase
MTEWLQHPETRQYSRRQRPLTDAELAARLNADNWIIEQDGMPAGVIRFDDLHGEREVSIYLSPAMKRQGIATAALRLLTGKLVAEVRPENTASVRLFERAGFRRCGDGFYRNH